MIKLRILTSEDSLDYKGGADIITSSMEGKRGHRIQGTDVMMEAAVQVTQLLALKVEERPWVKGIQVASGGWERQEDRYFLGVSEPVL